MRHNNTINNIYCGLHRATDRTDWHWYKWTPKQASLELIVEAYRTIEALEDDSSVSSSELSWRYNALDRVRQYIERENDPYANGGRGAYRMDYCFIWTDKTGKVRGVADSR